MSDVIRLTAAAFKHIQKWIAKENGFGLQIGIKQVGCSGLKYVTAIVNAPIENTEVLRINADINHPDNYVNIVIDAKSKPYIQGTCVDYVKPDSLVSKGMIQTPQLVFINPNEKAKCGCGESFSV